MGWAGDIFYIKRSQRIDSILSSKIGQSHQGTLIAGDRGEKEISAKVAQRAKSCSRWGAGPGCCPESQVNREFREDGKHSAVSVMESGSSRFYQGSGGESLLASGPAERGGKH